MRTAAAIILGSALVLSVPAWSIPSPDAGDDATTGKAPDAAAMARYSEALALLKKGDASEQQAASATSAVARKAALTDSQNAYTEAKIKFATLVAENPGMAEAWNSLGYTQRKTGFYDDALASYAKALELKPGYPEALEYRGEAYLRLNRIADAKQAYLQLFSSNRTISDHFLKSMQAWVRAKSKAPGDTDPAQVRELQKWVQERSQIAAQTASLTRAGAAESWH
ncbi:MAG TPA: tetratricopeptide repeat protein [Steroidobacteraceae bacterium]|nr:tetratricopeptide repeat protein [Steroidobacteraceae bacterium]